MLVGSENDCEAFINFGNISRDKNARLKQTMQEFFKQSELVYLFSHIFRLKFFFLSIIFLFGKETGLSLGSTSKEIRIKLTTKLENWKIMEPTCRFWWWSFLFRGRETFPKVVSFPDGKQHFPNDHPEWRRLAHQCKEIRGEKSSLATENRQNWGAMVIMILEITKYTKS